MDIDELRKDIVFSERIHGVDLVFHSTWGLFSSKEVDAGSRLLLEYFNINEDDVCLDLCCGYGVIGLTMAKLAPRGKVYMVDKDFVAVEYANKNAEINGLSNCKAFLSNAFSHIDDDLKFDVIASNLPAHVGGSLLRLMLYDANRHLKKGGRIYIVTISHLRAFIKRNLMEIFGNYEKVKQGRDYAVHMATKQK